MIRNKIYVFFFIFLLFFACESDKVNRITNVKYEKITDSIYTRLPGTLLAQGEYLVWDDPLAMKNLIHVLNAKTGVEIFSFGQIGDGPNEYNMPSVSLTFDSKILLYDSNKELQYQIDLEKAIKNPSLVYEHNIGEHTQGDLRILKLDDENLLSFNLDGETPFVLKHNGKRKYFGEFPFSDSISNRYNCFQGEILYHPTKKVVVYSLFNFPYLAIYRFKDGALIKEKELKKNVSYTITENQLRISKKEEKGMSDLSLSQDYIVMLKRDIEIEGPLPKPKKVRDMNQLSKSLYLYDYDLNLKKIINLKMPILRIAANAKSNTLYAIVANPEYAIIKFSLD